FQAEDGIRDFHVTGVQTCALPISARAYVDALLNKDGGTDTTGHHAHASRGGVRRGDDPGVFLKGGGLAPHQVQKAGPVYYAECEIGRASWRGRVRLSAVRAAEKDT